MILDTTAIIDIIRGNPIIDKKLNELNQRNVALFITSVSVFELWQGSVDIHNEEKINKIHTLLESLGTFLLDISAAKQAGTIHASLKKRGTVIDPEDSMIAGIAKLHNETILTRNIKHFGRIPALVVETY